MIILDGGMGGDEINLRLDQLEGASILSDYFEVNETTEQFARDTITTIREWCTFEGETVDFGLILSLDTNMQNMRLDLYRDNVLVSGSATDNA